jgi:succinate dehydrogenase/fumarate reductase cytochrome b subunit
MLSSTTYLGIPLAASLYLIGLAATSYHFAYGLAHLPSTWGIRVPERLGRWTVGASVTVGVIAFLVGASTVLYFATGSKMPGI